MNSSSPKISTSLRSPLTKVNGSSAARIHRSGNRVFYTRRIRITNRRTMARCYRPRVSADGEMEWLRVGSRTGFQWVYRCTGNFCHSEREEIPRSKLQRSKTRSFTG
jgi:hypothetical protein